MNELTSIAALIDAWPTIAEFARDIGVGYEAAKQMRRRGSIAIEHWPSVIASGRGQGLGVTSDLMMRLHTAKRAQEDRRTLPPFPAAARAES